MRKKKVAVWYWPGTNCEVESLKSWELLGADAELVFAKHFVSGAKKVTDYDLHHWTGGFTYGDDAGAGSIAALMAKEAIEILKGAGLPVIMECNGFQIGMRADVFGPGLALVQNDSGEFCSMPVLHRVVKSDCLWTKGLEGKVLRFPSAHRYGKLVVTGDRRPNVALVYASESPNGGEIAGIYEGNWFGLMDHPGRPYDNPDGLLIYANGLRAA
ncbi:hypothetical protein AUJ59_01620 [Candidatus Beckwithbacteria bacterium CG1_02_47_37]|uniref:Glutamine amidotransferase domain-containing protein n=1 Tax=Candidatus Beckwithbacteria bacterium CG1_02_47_37 TaxID=1805034 RepID=A0A1J4RPR2_9BACT|nr:MAG: hypothetical protein AUJ59_01620 [Candidatus Beckwithbacteria bacterium CG1_02_47_37]